MNELKIGERIVKLRETAGLTQAELAERLGVTDKAGSKWERGMGCPDVSVLEPLSSLFGVGAETLLAGELPCQDKTGGNMKKLFCRL